MLAKVCFDHTFSGDLGPTHFEFFITLLEVYWLRKKRRDGEYVSKFFIAKTGLPEGRRICKFVRRKIFESLDRDYSGNSDTDRFSDPEGGEHESNGEKSPNILVERVSGIQLHHGSGIRRLGRRGVQD